ncbi:hypothetical protein DEI92_04980 [Curtobacterium sp. MCBD17_034]|uniref:hypothetical protein n=1 Tax=unclassified Curtobacterium TaxID=257496 RepID=UPI000DA88525|nr:MULTISPECIES: hypothetical protein [unclassified Curtobacterium]PZF60977.1 hypothetical protein DEI92_04980 [Curtobacterium sp. MCBD17_034]PZM40327.1 hypothetical protein DEI90_01215 [Curtobacterium sp. MCBD17_031]WIB64847.1 hypothetical protein DEI94_06575 [Curtobacterium sp. MCBD17_040]
MSAVEVAGQAPAVSQQFTLRDVAEVAYQHAVRQMRALESKLSAFQSINRNVGAMYGASGSGREN